MARPSVTLNCVADKYADKRSERIVEFDGGLIAFRRHDDGTLTVDLYRLDANVRVRVAAENLASR